VRSSSLGRFASSEVCDRCGRSRMRCHTLMLASLRLARLRTIIVRSPAALLAWASGRALGRPLNDSSPVAVIQQRHRNSRARRRHRLPWRFRVESINRTTRLSRRTLHDRPDHYGVCGWRFRSSACVVILRSGASLEVLSPSALAGRVALFEAGPADSSAGPLPAIEQSRFGVSRDRPRYGGLTIVTTPLRSFALRKLPRRCSRDG